MTVTVRFGTDGWRGIIAEDFTFAAVRRVAQALALELRERLGPPGQGGEGGQGAAARRHALELAEDQGELDRITPLPAYQARLAELVDLEALRNAGLTVVVDAMFGAGAGVLPKLLAAGPTKTIAINGTV